MTSRIRSVLVLSALLALTGQCSWQTVANRGENTLGVVRFPEAWTKTSADGSTSALTDTRGFDIRKKADSQTEELVFRMKGMISTSDQKSESVYSDEVYAVSLDNRFSVHAATVGEWERAEQLASTRQQIRWNKYEPSSGPVTQEGLSYQGKLFAKSGEFWGSTVGLVSRNNRWLAVFSFASSAKPERSWSTLDGGMPDEPRPGEIFVDVYDTSSGKRIQSGHARYENSPSTLFDAALWAGDSYLVVPLDRLKPSDITGQACWLAILPTP